MYSVKYKITERVIRGITRFFPRVVHNQTVYTDEFLKNVLGLGSTLTLGDLKAAVEMINQGLVSELRQGNRVVLPWGSYGLAARGQVESADAHFKKGQNEFIPRLNPSKELKKALADTRAKKVRSEAPNPLPRRVTDTATGLANQTLTPGGIAVVKGQDLKFDPGDLEQGIFLVPRDIPEGKQGKKGRRSQTKEKPTSPVRAEFYGEVNPTQVSFVTPVVSQMGRGSFRLELRTRDRSSGEIVSKSLKYTLGSAPVTGK